MLSPSKTEIDSYQDDILEKNPSGETPVGENNNAENSAEEYDHEEDPGEDDDEEDPEQYDYEEDPEEYDYEEDPEEYNHEEYGSGGYSNEEYDFCRCLERIDLLFQRDYLQREGLPPASLQHYFLPSELIAYHLTEPVGEPCWFGAQGVYLPDSREWLNWRLEALIAAFDLTPCERDILLLGLLPRISTHYATLPNSKLRESFHRHWLIRLFADTEMEARLLHSALHPSSPLFQFHLLTTEKSTGNKSPSAVVIVNEALWHFFCGEKSAVTWNYPYTRWAVRDNTGWYPPLLAENLCRLSLRTDNPTPPVVVLEGHGQDGRELALVNILAQYGYGMLCLDGERIAELTEAQQQLAIAEIMRETRLHSAGLVLENIDSSDKSDPGYLQLIEQLSQQVVLPLFILAQQNATVPAFRRLAVVHLAMPHPDAEEKMALLQQAWPVYLESSEKQALSSLVQRYPFNPTDVPLLIQEADYYRQIRDSNAVLDMEDLRQTLARRSRRNFGKLAQRITPKRSFADIVLSPALKIQLDEILAAIRLRESVTRKHFSHKTGGKIGLSALFYGDSGTGKTLAAEVLAHALGVDLIKVDLSTVVNKYIGETEKNLAALFDLAQADSGVLFFDEADALFGKRSEAKDAHDRHANIEVSYLLQRLENYPGLVILATNNRNHLDSAFNRRLTFITRFTYPDVILRTQMWHSAWPATLKVADNINFAALAACTELTGANIHNVALLAAVLAAEHNSELIERHHIEHAINRELSKQGRLSL